MTTRAPGRAMARPADARSAPRGAGRARLAVSLLAVLVLASGCKSVVHGNGVFGQETRNVGTFDGVSIGLGIIGTVRAGATETTVTISGDANILQYIKTEVVGTTLTTHLSGVSGFDSDHAVQLVVTTPALVFAQAYDRAQVDAASIVETGTFTGDASSGSSLKLTGAAGVQATLLALTASGTSTIDAAGYPAGDGTATLDGGSSAVVTVPSPGTVTGDLTNGSALTVEGGGACAVSTAGGSSCVEVP